MLLNIALKAFQEQAEDIAAVLEELVLEETFRLVSTSVSSAQSRGFTGVQSSTKQTSVGPVETE